MIQEIYERLTAALPRKWFSENNSMISAITNACAGVLSSTYDSIQETALQLRIATATGGALDLISADFFGTSLPRKDGESDNLFRMRIRANLFRERATRKGVRTILEELTGQTPLIFEPNNAEDVFFLNKGFLNHDIPGSLSYPYQGFITAFRSVESYKLSTGYLNNEFLNNTAILVPNETSALPDLEIIDAVNATKAYGTTVWIRVRDVAQ